MSIASPVLKTILGAAMGSALSTSSRPLHATIGENGKVEPDFHHGAQQSSKRMKAITVCTSTYAKHTRRLTASFFKWHPDGSLVVYCDDARIVSKELANLPCRVVELPSIRTIGVKRSKFEACTLAAEDGDFLYLDSDIIVLGPLDNLQDQNSIVACRDDLGECPFIENKLFPWASDPELKADRYINSGVIYFPSALLPTLKEIRLQSLKDDVWRRYTIEGMLSDNHFLCAFQLFLMCLLDLQMAPNTTGKHFAVSMKCSSRGVGLKSSTAGAASRSTSFISLGSPKLTILFCASPPMSCRLWRMPSPPDQPTFCSSL